IQLGDALREQRRVAEAVKRYREGLSILERFPDYDRPWTNPMKIQHQALALGKVASALRASEQLGEAEDVSTEAMAACTKWATDPPFKSLALKLRGMAQEQRGSIRAESGRLADAESDFREVLEFWDQLALKDEDFAIRRIPVRSELGNLLWATGHREEARVLF